jgi:hypothetical protein
MENSTDSPHPIRYRCEAKALGEFARGDQGSGGLAFTIIETKEGRLAGQGPGEGRTEVACRC